MRAVPSVACLSERRPVGLRTRFTSRAVGHPLSALSPGLHTLLLRLIAGRGGAGCASFARARFRRVGPPNGGDGGDGGNVVIQTSASVSCLPSYRHVVVVRAENGAPGQRWERHGRRGMDVRFVVPPGTLLRWLHDPETLDRSRSPVFLNLNETADDRRINETVRALAALESALLHAEVANGDGALAAPESAAPALVSTPSSLAVSRTPVVVASSVVAATGGRGGRGNTFYQSSVNRSPRQAQSGLQGERQLIMLEKLPAADVALIGSPNAGKSSLMAMLTRARPLISPHAYTTNEPVLGVLEDHQTWMRSILVEIPARALEGAQQNREHVWHLLRACRHVVAVVDKHTATGSIQRLREQIAMLKQMVAPRVLAACVASMSYPPVMEPARTELPRFVHGVPFLTRLNDVRKTLLDLAEEPPHVQRLDGNGM